MSDTKRLNEAISKIGADADRSGGTRPERGDPPAAVLGEIDGTISEKAALPALEARIWPPRLESLEEQTC